MAKSWFQLSSILSLAAAGVVIPSAITRPTPTTSHMPPSATIMTATNVTTASPCNPETPTAPSNTILPIQMPVLMQVTVLPQHPIPNRNDTNASAKASKMHVSPKHNGQNLCAHRWLQQFKGKSAAAGGMRDQFKAYWDGLGKVKQQVYDNEADTLVSAKHYIIGLLTGMCR
ncbi:hypothetical protein BS17DRAFT_786333 [Gyrodon lividus]|nr:hypothetical protein BS17DRAFT_786333 [Gyrodon lividus]